MMKIFSQKNHEVTFSTSVNIQPYYPAISVVVQLSLKERTGDEVVCILIPAKLV